MIEVRFPDGAPVKDYPIALCAGPGPSVDTALEWGSNPDSLGDVVRSSTAVYIRSTNDGGQVSFGGLADGPVSLAGLRMGVFPRRMEPRNPVVPAVERISVEVDRLFAIGLRLEDDTALSAYLDAYDGRRVMLAAGPRMAAAARLGQAVIGGGIIIPLMRAAAAHDRDVLEWEASGTATLVKHGPIRFRAKPVYFDDLANAPLWDSNSTPERGQHVGEVRLTAVRPEQAEVLAAMDTAVIRMVPVVTSTGGAVSGAVTGPETVSGRSPYRLAVGRYRCEPATDLFRGRVITPSEVEVVVGDTTRIAVEFTEPFVPLRLYVVNRENVHYPGGPYRVSFIDRKCDLTGSALGRYDQNVFWLPSGRLLMSVHPDSTRSGTEELELPRVWTTVPLEYFMTVP